MIAGFKVQSANHYTMGPRLQILNDLSSAYYAGLLMKVVHKNVTLSCRQTIIKKDFQAEFTGNIT